MCNNVTKAIEAIRKLDSASQVNQVIEAIKLQQTFVARSAARSITVGTMVSFQGRRGQRVTGEVTKVNQKTVVVSAHGPAGGTWKVTASMLEAVQ